MLTSGEVFTKVQQGFGNKRILFGVIHIDTAPKSIKQLTSPYRCGKRDGSFACKKCGIVPSLIIKYRHKNEPESTVHTDMFHIGKNGGLTMMTVDHILPKSAGGTDRLTNLEIMCQRCNSNKGSAISDEQLITIINQLDLHLCTNNISKLMSFIVFKHVNLLSIPGIDQTLEYFFKKLTLLPNYR